MHLVRRWHLAKPLRLQQQRFVANANTAAEQRIEIPNRIQRSATDLLRALASTVGRDATAAHYKYHDDPYLIPSSNMSKRAFANAQEAGRKAARWIRQEHRELFQHKEAQPSIEAFAPKMVFNAESEVSEATLDAVITQGEVTDAALVYNLLKEKSKPINEQLKQRLLELICFYNNEEQVHADDIEERWFKQNADARERVRKTWKDGDLAETIFAEIEPKTAAAYAALIRGMAKYNQHERAFALLQQAMEKQFEMDTNTFNSIISISPQLCETADQRWQQCLDLLQQMSRQKLRPNIGTMNALMETISTFGNFKFARSCTFKVLAEFKALGIAPSLGTYYYVLKIFCRERAPVSHVLVDILNEITGQSFEIVHANDVNFFVTAMDVARNHLHDKALAQKVDELLHTGNNYNLIGDSYRESIYYRHYLALLCQTCTIAEFMQHYDLLVPHLYVPEPGIMEEILKAIELNDAAEQMPRLWSDIVIFDHTNRESLLTRTLKIMLNFTPDLQNPTQQELPAQFAKVALDIYKKFQDSEDRNNKKLTLTGQIAADVLTLLVRNNSFQEAYEVFDNIDKNQHRIPGTPSESCLQEYIDACILNKAPTAAVQCLQYAVDNNMDSLPLARKINAGFTLNEVHLSKLRSLVGEDFEKERVNRN